MVGVPVTRVDVDEVRAKTWKLGHWDVRISWLELLLRSYLDHPQHFIFSGGNENFEVMTNVGHATFCVDNLQHLTPETILEQLEFVTTASARTYIRRYNRSMHRFFLWIDVNNMTPKIIEAEWIPRETI